MKNLICIFLLGISVLSVTAQVPVQVYPDQQAACLKMCKSRIDQTVMYVFAVRMQRGLSPENPDKDDSQGVENRDQQYCQCKGYRVMDLPFP